MILLYALAGTAILIGIVLGCTAVTWLWGNVVTEVYLRLVRQAND